MAGSFMLPLIGGVNISQAWGVPDSSYAAGHHTGIDFAVMSGSKVLSVMDGVVRRAGFDKDYGNYVQIEHPNGMTTLYAHLGNYIVAKGTTVKGGQVIGMSGNSGNSKGPHLHFEVRTGTTANGGGAYKNNVDPLAYFNTAALSSMKTSSASVTAAISRAMGSGGGGGGSGGGGGVTNTVTYTNSGGSGGGAAVSEKPLTAQDFGFSSAFLAANPEINNLVNEAIKNQWTNAQLQGRVIDTAWYRARSKAQREYDMGSISDPATYAEAERKMLEDLTRLAGVMGVSSANLQTEAKNAVRNGLTANDYIGFLAVRANYSEEQVGRAGMVQQQILGYAEDYGVTAGPDEVNRIMRDVLSTGSDWDGTLAGYEDHFRERAKAMYSGVAKQIDAGATVKDILNPYLSRAAEMLGTPVEQMSTANGQWNRAITGAVPLTLQEWETQVRKDPTYKWDKGPQAIEWARNVGDEFMKVFGAQA